MYWDCYPTIYRPSTATDRGHYGLTKPLPDINLLSVQRQTLQTVTRYSYGVSSFCCCSRNCDAEHRGKRPFDLPTDDTTLVTPLRWRGSPYLASEEELIAAGLGPYLKRCLIVTGGGCRVDAPVNLKLLLDKSLSFVDEQGRKTAPRPVEKVQIKFTDKELFRRTHPMSQMLLLWKRLL